VTILSDIQQNILDWYAAYGRDLPRRRTQDPYAIHVSEVMLQQTQVDRVIPYFHTWLKKWPNYSALAAADTTELLSYRSGLGFNSRALRLRACAKEINEKLKTNNGQS
jgi:A/G-specific adenine glycosylase